MAIELSNLTFTEQDDIVIDAGIVNTGIANTLAGNDVITGNPNPDGVNYGFKNVAAFNSGDGNDTITGSGDFSGILLSGYSSTFETGKGNDVIYGYGGDAGLTNESTNLLNTDDGDDLISCAAAKAIVNEGIINTGNGEDEIMSQGTFFNSGRVFLGDGNDRTFVTNRDPHNFLGNLGFIDTGDGNDMITTYGVIYNEGLINTGNGDDSITVAPVFERGSVGYGLYNNGGTINMGNGNDSIIVKGPFESGLNSSGSVFLGEGEDYVKGFGGGDFYGGNGNDILELTPGTYTVGIWDTTVTLAQGNQLMITSEFEKLMAGGTTYDFASLTAGQIITVA